MFLCSLPKSSKVLKVVVSDHIKEANRWPESLSLLHAEPGRCQSSVAQAAMPSVPGEPRHVSSQSRKSIGCQVTRLSKF